MHRRHLLVASLVSTAAGVATRGAARAQDAVSWPSRTITFVIPGAAGSAFDIVGRMVAEGWAARLGQPMVTDNRVSANGVTGLGQVARAAPDGYTVAVTIQTHIAFNPFLFASLPYDPLRDFAAVTQLAAVSNALVVPRTSAFQNVADIIAAARARPDTLTYSSAAVGSTHHVSGALLAEKAGLRLVHVPYRGGPAAQIGVQTGQVDFAFLNIPPLLGMIRSGDLRALAVTSAKRSTLLPDVPTMQEEGIDGYEMSTWMGLVTVAGTPAPIVGRMQEVTRAVLAEEAPRQRLTEIGFDLVPQITPEEMTAYHRAEHEKWGAFLRAAGIRPD